MKKTLLSLSLGLLITGGLQAQTTLFSEDFNSTTGTDLPTGWSLVPPSTTSWKTGTASALSGQSFGFPTNDGRLVAINDDKEGQGVDNSNALLVSPSYNLTGQTGVYLAMDIFFQKQIYDGASESLTIEGSTDGGTTWTVLSTVDANQLLYWETRYVPLGALNGQSNVKIGFRYKDGGGWLYGAAMDNFKLFVPLANDIQLSGVTPTAADPNFYGAVGTAISINGTVTNLGSTPVTSYTLHYKQGSSAAVSVPQTVSPAIGLGQSVSLSNVNFNIPSVGAFPLDVWITLSGDTNSSNDSATAFVQGVANMPAKKLAFEEATGTWCVWCPRGSVKMEEFADSNPGVAAQIAVHNADPMTIPSYDAKIGTYISGYPSIVVDRTLVGDPGDVASLHTSNMNNFGFATVTLGTPNVSGSSVTAPVTITPSIDIAGAKLALVITESNVTGTGAGWGQKNAYAGGGSGDMGGYESQPALVEGVNYHFVARSITPSADGDVSGLPANLVSGTPYTANLTATLDANWKTQDLQYIVLLIGSDGKS